MFSCILRISTLILLLGVYGITDCKKGAIQSISNQVDELLRNRIEATGIPPKITVGKELIYASVMLPRFYERRIYQPAWSNDKGPLPVVGNLIEAINEADLEGLRSTDYHLTKIETTLTTIRENQKKKRALNPRRLVDFDLLCSDAFLIYGSHLLAGRINPQTIDSEWFANRREADMAEVLQNAINNGQVKEALKSLLPPQPGYTILRKALARYQAIAEKNCWPLIPEGSKMQQGDRNERIIVLRNRLLATGDLKIAHTDSLQLFDNTLESAVRNFQQRHGLDVDGIVDVMTLAALNVPVEERINQIILNMERWRWLPQELGQRHILVNIADFELDVIEDGQPEMIMRVIVGKTYRRTPVFSDLMTYLVFNPYWHVPPSIAKNDILPLVRKDSTYLTKKNIKVFQSWGTDTQEINPTTINWSQITTRNLDYRFRQDPGPENALGRVKFMFPNQFNVYLHDTPARELFQKTIRGFSSGCIRVEKPIELAEYVLRGDPTWTRKNILAAIERKVEQTVRLPEPIPVHLLYWTCWATKDGNIHFRNDIYERDKPLTEALREEPPRK